MCWILPCQTSRSHALALFYFFVRWPRLISSLLGFEITLSYIYWLYKAWGWVLLFVPIWNPPFLSCAIPIIFIYIMHTDLTSIFLSCSIYCGSFIMWAASPVLPLGAGGMCFALFELLVFRKLKIFILVVIFMLMSLPNAYKPLFLTASICFLSFKVFQLFLLSQAQSSIANSALPFFSLFFHFLLLQTF